jgi:hypothetical protein
MADPNNAGNERRKWMIVGGLALSFIVVLWVQLSPDGEDAPRTQLAERPRKAASAGGPSATSGAWPRIALTEALKHNPFAPLPQPEPVVETT